LITLVQRAIDRLVENKTTADTILVLEDGRIAEQGTHDDLMDKNCRYATMWISQ
jgi:ATP-binding cassette subfamily B protein